MVRIHTISKSLIGKEWNKYCETFASKKAIHLTVKNVLKEASNSGGNFI